MTLEPCERSETYVNGKRVAQPVQLRSGETGRSLGFSRDHMACVNSSVISEFLFKDQSDGIRVYVFGKLQMLSFCIRESEVLT